MKKADDDDDEEEEEGGDNKEELLNAKAFDGGAELQQELANRAATAMMGRETARLGVVEDGCVGMRAMLRRGDASMGRARSMRADEVEWGRCRWMRCDDGE